MVDSSALEQRKLGIHPSRRVAGAGLVLAMYAVAGVGFWHTVAFGRAELPLQPVLTLLCAFSGTPFLLLPCILDRFPQVVIDVVPVPQLRQMARWFFGVEYHG